MSIPQLTSCAAASFWGLLVFPMGLDLGTTSANFLRYDYANRLVEAREGNSVSQYCYDALGRRIEKSVDGVSTRFVYAGEQIVEEQSAHAGSVSYVHGLGIDSIVQRRNGGASQFFHADDQGSTLALSNGTGQILERYSYDDFGRANAPSILGNRFLFTGREFDTETSLYHYRSRAYEPRAARFTQRDSIGIWGDRANRGNGSAYVFNNPQSYVDPFGAERWPSAPSDWLGGVSTPEGSNPAWLANGRFVSRNSARAGFGRGQTFVERNGMRLPPRETLTPGSDFAALEALSFFSGLWVGFWDSMMFGTNSYAASWISESLGGTTRAELERERGTKSGFAAGDMVGDSVGLGVNVVFGVKGGISLAARLAARLGNGTRAIVRLPIGFGCGWGNSAGGLALAPAGEFVITQAGAIKAAGAVTGAGAAVIAHELYMAGDRRSSGSGGSPQGPLDFEDIERGVRGLSDEIHLASRKLCQVAIGVSGGVVSTREAAIAFDQFLLAEHSEAITNIADLNRCAESAIRSMKGEMLKQHPNASPGVESALAGIARSLVGLIKEEYVTLRGWRR